MPGAAFSLNVWATMGPSYVRRLGNHLPRPTYAVVVSLLAVTIGGGGSAIAAKKISQYDSRHIKDNAVTTQHLQSSQLNPQDFSAATRSFMSTSEAQRGLQGAIGPDGPKGVIADRQYTYASRDTDKLKNPQGNPPNVGKSSWELLSGTVNGASSAGYEPLTSSSLANQPYLTLQTSDANAGYVRFRTRSDFLLTGNVTLWHKGTVHTRAECVVQSARATNGSILSGYTDASAPIVVSSARDHEVHTITLVGGSTADGTEDLPGEYVARVACRNVDRTAVSTLANDWVFVKGNLSVIASRD